MDIGPPSQKHKTRSHGGVTDEPAIKRQKLTTESQSEKRNASKEITPPVAAASNGKIDSTTKVNIT